MLLVFYSNFAMSSDVNLQQRSLSYIPDSQLNQFEELICFGCQMENPIYSSLSQEFVQKRS